MVFALVHFDATAVHHQHLADSAKVILEKKAA
jgi:hypothetical protein